MDMLEHFEDNMNTNISNTINVANFIKVGKTVVANLDAKYHNGEFVNPAKFDPRSEIDGWYEPEDNWWGSDFFYGFQLKL